MRILLAVTLVILAMTTVALSETYRWEDAGGVHFTDDLNSVPKKYRKSALISNDSTPAEATPSEEKDNSTDKIHRCVFEAIFNDSTLNFREILGYGTNQECANKCMAYRSKAQSEDRFRCDDDRLEVMCYYGDQVFYDDMLHCTRTKN